MKTSNILKVSGYVTICGFIIWNSSMLIFLSFLHVKYCFYLAILYLLMSSAVAIYLIFKKKLLVGITVLMTVFLATYGFGSYRSNLINSISAGNLEAVKSKVIFNHINFRHLPFKGNETTPLIRAASRGNFEILEYFLSIGGDVGMATNSGKRAIHFAQPNSIPILLRHGANINTKDKQGRTPLLMAIQNSSYNKAQKLLDFKPDIDAQDNEGRTALISLYANERVIYKNEKVKNLITSLKRLGANEESKDINGISTREYETYHTFLHSLITGDYEKMETIYKRGINTKIKTISRKNILQMIFPSFSSMSVADTKKYSYIVLDIIEKTPNMVHENNTGDSAYGYLNRLSKNKLLLELVRKAVKTGTKVPEHSLNKRPLTKLN